MDNMDHFLPTIFPQLSVADLPSEDRHCPICQMEYGQTIDDSPSEHPVRTLCSHIFGRICILTWCRDAQNNPATCPLCRQPLFGGLDRAALDFWVQEANVSRLSGLGGPDNALRALDLQLPHFHHTFNHIRPATGIQIRMHTYGDGGNSFLPQWDSDLVGYRYEEWDADTPGLPSWTGIMFRYHHNNMLPRWVFLQIPIENGIYRLHPGRFQIGPEDLTHAPSVRHSLRRPIDPTPRPNATEADPLGTWDSRLSREQILIVDAHRMTWHLCWLTQSWRFNTDVDTLRSDRRNEAIMVRLCVARAGVIVRLRELDERMMSPNLLHHDLLEAAALAINPNATSYRRHAEEHYARGLAAFAPEAAENLPAASPPIAALQVLPGTTSDVANAIYEAVDRALVALIDQAIVDSHNDFPGENLYETFRADPELQDYLATRVPAFSGNAVPEVLLQTAEARGAPEEQGVLEIPLIGNPDVGAPIIMAVTDRDTENAEIDILRVFGVGISLLD